MACDPDKYSVACLIQVARGAGFGKTDDMLVTAVAVALAESSGRTKAVSVTGCCIGLWQINTRVHPYTKTQMNDPTQNAAAAWSISKQGTDWSPWTAYNTGAYLLYKSSVERQLGATPGSADVSDTASESVGSGDVFDTIGDIVMFPELVRQWLSDRNNITRIMKVMTGAGLILAGVVLVVKPVFAPAAKAVIGAVK